MITIFSRPSYFNLIPEFQKHVCILIRDIIDTNFPENCFITEIVFVLPILKLNYRQIAD